MKGLLRSGSFAIVALLAVLLTACSGITDQNTPTTTTNQNMNNGNSTKQNMNNGTTTTKTTPTSNGNTMKGIPITPGMTGDMTAFIRMGKATIDGKTMNVLLTNKGFAVYYYKPDTILQSTCTGQCAKDWPPILVSQGMTVSSSVALPKQLSVHQTTNGTQVFYDGHALYTYADDKQAGQATGHGEDMEWYLVDTMMSSMTSMNNGNNGTPVATTTPTNNGNNGNMTQGITITPSITGNMAAFIHTGKAAINGNQVSVLLTNKNFAVYYYKDDTTLKATCTGDCAKDWPPVLAPQGMMTVSSSGTLPKQLSVHQTANGAQVFYDGHALYTYAEDKQAGHATGRGEDQKWYLVGFLL
jgi:predicted lipoprotein with Yx(FWY)xxD motif